MIARFRCRGWLVLCLTLYMILTTAGTASAQPGDISGHWAENQISVWVNAGLISGYEDGTFKPNNSITRAEFAVLANKVCGYTASTPANFSDVKPTDWYYGEVSKAVAAGYISGYTDGTFRPNGIITRQEAAVMISRMLKLVNTESTVLNTFTDANSIPQWSREAISAVVTKGYMKGYPDQTFQATKSMNRAEAVVVLDGSVGIKANTSTITYDKAGTYGPATGTTTFEGNVVISVPGVTLQNTVITRQPAPGGGDR